jgi:hypothetical protein
MVITNDEWRVNLQPLTRKEATYWKISETPKISQYFDRNLLYNPNASSMFSGPLVFRRYSKFRKFKDKIKGVKQMFFSKKKIEKLEIDLLQAQLDISELKSDLSSARYIADQAKLLASQGKEYFVRFPYHTSAESLKKEGYEYMQRLSDSDNEMWIKTKKPAKVKSKTKKKKKK